MEVVLIIVNPAKFFIRLLVSVIFSQIQRFSCVNIERRILAWYWLVHTRTYTDARVSIIMSSIKHFKQGRVLMRNSLICVENWGWWKQRKRLYKARTQQVFENLILYIWLRWLNNNTIFKRIVRRCFSPSGLLIWIFCLTLSIVLRIFEFQFNNSLRKVVIFFE